MVTEVLYVNGKEEMRECLLTIFTPAYNRAHTLGRTYESLCHQSRKDFIWLIVDDGSRDETRTMIEAWQRADNGFQINYLYKSNGGMHTAHNMAYENIDTVLNVCIDSDDCLADGAIEKIYAKWEEIKDKDYAGIVGLDADMNGALIGNAFPDDMTETTLSAYYAKGGKGDKKLIYRTEIVNQFPPYPVFEDEKYVGLDYKYRLIDQKYTLATMNEVLCNVEYQHDGSSATMWKQYKLNPKGFAFLRTVYMKYATSRKRALIDAVHYVSSSILARDKRFILHSPRKILTLCAIPAGVVLAFVTLVKGK